MADAVLVEAKAVAALLPTHYSQVLTWLRRSHIRIGLLMNVHAIRPTDSLRRFIV
jgi:GxxExxY protein